MKILFVVSLLLSAVLSAVFTRYIIPILKSKKMGQKILDIGPRWHKSKEGTPTMGGIAFIAAMTITVIISAICAVCFDFVADGEVKNFIIGIALCFGFALICGFIGVIDDRAKLSHNQNEGLKAHEKYLLQLISAAAYLFAAKMLGVINTALYIPYFNVTVELGIFYYVVMLILITGVVNSVNLTDGIDGLAATTTAVGGAFFAVVSFISANSAGVLLSSVMIGGCLGFLVYNFHPARVFMGDTGSLFLGGFFVALAVLVGNPLISLIAGMVYIIETASVMLQVAYFKLTHGKRIFKMTPIHHHFEKCNWSEVKIVSVFSTFAIIFAIVAYFGMGI